MSAAANVATPPSSTPSGSSLALHALGFVVRTEGAWSERALTRFRLFLRSRGYSLSPEELSHELAAAKAKYERQGNALFVCSAEPCRRAEDSDVTSELQLLAIGVAVSSTGCQGHCKQAPLMTLRIGKSSQLFGRVETRADRAAIGQFARAAATANSLLVPGTGAEDFRYDPLHRETQPGGALNAVRFLLGHFRGEGHFAEGGLPFQKEVIGNYEAGGRFIALRMQAQYQLADGSFDTHRAFVVVGSEQSGIFKGRAYTDGGAVQDYVVERSERGLEFADALPDHGRHWRRARKILTPSDDGYEERLEVDAGEGFSTYYSLRMTAL